MQILGTITIHILNDRLSQAQNQQVLINGVVAGVLEGGEISFHKMIKSIVKSGHLNKSNCYVCQSAVMVVILHSFRHNSQTKLVNNQKRNTNKFIKISATLTRSKKFNNQQFVREESLSLMMRQCRCWSRRRRRGHRYLRDTVCRWILFLMICRNKVKKYEAGGQFIHCKQCMVRCLLFLIVDKKIKRQKIKNYNITITIKSQIYEALILFKNRKMLYFYQVVDFVVDNLCMCKKQQQQKIVKFIQFVTAQQIVRLINKMSETNNNSEYQSFNGQQRDKISGFQVVNYRQLYFEALKKINRLSSVQNLFHNTLSTVNNIQINDIITQHEKNITILQKQLNLKDKQYSKLQHQLQKQQQSHNQRQDTIQKKLQLQIRRRNLTLDENCLLKSQLNICRKQLQYVIKQNQQLKQLINNNNSTKQDKQRQNSIIATIEQNDIEDNSYKQLVKRQQILINQLQNNLQQIKQTNNAFSSTINKLKQQNTTLSQIHQLQIQSKIHIIKQLQQELNTKQKLITKLQTNPHQYIIENNHNNHSININKLQSASQSSLSLLSNQKDKLIIKRLNSKISKLQQLIQSYQQHQQHIYKELIQKDMQIEQSQHKEQLFLSKIKQLEEIIKDIKSSYIYMELQKDQLINKHKNKQKSLKASTITSLSISKLNLTQHNTTSSNNSTLTPCSSLNNSRIKSINSTDFIDKSSSNLAQGQNNITTQKNYLTSKTNKLNQIKNSFYKNKTPKTINKKYSQNIFPFQL